MTESPVDAEINYSHSVNQLLDCWCDFTVNVQE